MKPSVPHVFRKALLLVLAAACSAAVAGPTFPEQGAPKAEPPPVSSGQSAATPAPVENDKRTQLEAEIRALEAEKAEMLVKFSAQHPDVRAVDRKLRIRRAQLDELKLGSGTKQ